MAAFPDDDGEAASQTDQVGVNSGSVCVAGATSHVGGFLLPRLIRAGHIVHAVSRRRIGSKNGDSPPYWHQLDIGKEDCLEDFPAVGTLIHLAPLWLLAPHVGGLAGRGVTRIVAFGSTSVFSKQESRDAGERNLALALRTAEERLAAACAECGINWTVFRPTLTYGGDVDTNVALIGRFISRFGFFPLAGQASGLRQPVHAEDLATACLDALNCKAAFNRAYNLSGAEVLTYRQMVEKIFRAQRRRPRFVRMSMTSWRVALGMARLLGMGTPINLQMIARMNENLVFGHDDAQRDFGYAPRSFMP